MEENEQLESDFDKEMKVVYDRFEGGFKTTKAIDEFLITYMNHFKYEHRYEALQVFNNVFIDDQGSKELLTIPDKKDM